MKSIFCKMVAELESEKSFQSLEYNKAAALRTILILEFQKKRTDVETSLHHCLIPLMRMEQRRRQNPAF
ncbi:BnaA08g20990D [Brassica napus]|uniref:(rape) hypothetical protein n=1 Tax=Brassica napus TaxID=3708 RepID=A0A078HUI6_BRANA|nr:unnamed protein product [Brassica napus]CDY41497.1 BnaA08g20990D [Brassica napus]